MRRPHVASHSRPQPRHAGTASPRHAGTASTPARRYWVPTPGVAADTVIYVNTSGVGPISRRTVLTATAVVPVGLWVVGCGDEPDPQQQEPALTLRALLDSAGADAAAATAVAEASLATPDLAASARAVAAHRTEHARLITDEFVRAVRQSPASAGSSASSAGTPAPSAPDLAALRAMLSNSATAATDAAVASTGARAVLLARVGTSCRVSADIELVFP